MPALGCLNIHGALLPEYRGVMPSFWMLANGEREAGVTIYFMNEAIDAGEVAAQQPFEIGPTETLDDFVRRSKRIAADLLVEVLHDVEDGNSSRRSMNLSEGSYYSWPTRDVVQQFRAAGRQLGLGARPRWGSRRSSELISNRQIKDFRLGDGLGRPSPSRKYRDRKRQERAPQTTRRVNLTVAGVTVRTSPLIPRRLG
jgi:hypothetical protein